MTEALTNCKITVIKKSLNKDLIEKYLDDKNQNITACERMELGQEFLIQDLTKPPEGFCEWAWADIRHDILNVASGGNSPGFKKQGTLISACTDWSRPVYFLIEKIN